MTRLPRLDVPGIPQHVVQRGNNRGVCFFSSRDRTTYLDCLVDAAPKACVDIHAFVLMTNHVHLLLTGHKPGAASELMQAVGRRYVRYVNRARGRSGTLFEGRFKASLIQSERYMLNCYRYVELNPVRAGLVKDPADYPWSSYRHNAQGEKCPAVTAHPLYEGLGATATERQAAYRALFEDGLGLDDLEAIRLHAARNSALGTPFFQAEIQALTRRRAHVPPIGRPRKVRRES